MKRITLTLLLPVLFFAHLATGYACSCSSFPSSFCSDLDNEDLVIHGKVLQHYSKLDEVSNFYLTFIDVEVLKILNHEMSYDTISILGQDGTSCGIPLEKFGEQTYWIFKSREMSYFKDHYKTSVDFPVFNLNPCSIHYLEVIDNEVIGKISPATYRLSLEDFQNNLPSCFSLLNSSDKDDDDISFQVVPNLVTHSVVIQKGVTAIDIQSEEAWLYILDANGQIAFTYYLSKETSEKRINMSDFKAGIYFFAFRSARGNCMQKVIKLADY